MVQVKVLMKISESPRKSLKSVKVLCVFDIMSAITHGSDGECKLTSISEFEKLECDSSSIQDKCPQLRTEPSGEDGNAMRKAYLRCHAGIYLVCDQHIPHHFICSSTQPRCLMKSVLIEQ